MSRKDQRRVIILALVESVLLAKPQLPRLAMGALERAGNRAAQLLKNWTNNQKTVNTVQRKMGLVWDSIPDDYQNRLSVVLSALLDLVERERDLKPDREWAYLAGSLFTALRHVYPDWSDPRASATCHGIKMANVVRGCI